MVAEIMDSPILFLLCLLLLTVLLCALLLLVQRRRNSAEEMLTCMATLPGDLPKHQRKGRRQVLRSPHTMPRDEFLPSLPWLIGLGCAFLIVFALSLFAIG
ncbi:hypothetical protein [Chitinilyticum aquatile]|uniref:hypothetical protein n=1 Tax=Chitinilyticum aquatile TaxID=362520 RepID=UPI0003F55B3E|nr:hypothetical protein [Chitinilyticum aquatile]